MPPQAPPPVYFAPGTPVVLQGLASQCHHKHHHLYTLHRELRLCCKALQANATTSTTKSILCTGNSGCVARPCKPMPPQAPPRVYFAPGTPVVLQGLASQCHHKHH